jgi:gentisate 1,2-dioxygenase
MSCRIQLLRPKEHTQAHRHTGSAVYHVVQGQGQTIIDGKSFTWRKGDIIALPPWSLHEHINGSAKADAMLFSIQDAPVLHALGLYKEEEYTENGGQQKVTAVFGA